MTPYKNCHLCPRSCGVDREAGQRGYCGETAALRIAFAGIHRGEEPPITGTGGSGTIFISGCNLGCTFCQNYQISSGVPLCSKEERKAAMGRVVETTEFAYICLALQDKGVENINIVTGSHAAPAITAGIREARKQGLCIPVLWNSSGYDGEETLSLLEDIVDLYLPDLKTLYSGFAAKFFNASDYPEHAKAAILKMMENKALCFKKSTGSMVSGVMVRHLIIPGHLENTRQVLVWFKDNCAGRALLSLMTQYTVTDTFLSKAEYEAVLNMLHEFKINDGFCQELVTGTDWLPDFRRQNPFSSELSVPVWHWQDEKRLI